MKPLPRTFVAPLVAVALLSALMPLTSILFSRLFPNDGFPWVLCAAFLFALASILLIATQSRVPDSACGPLVTAMRGSSRTRAKVMAISACAVLALGLLVRGAIPDGLPFQARMWLGVSLTTPYLYLFWASAPSR